ncbi:hypothetical protein ABZP36_034953 [Zizania latifolia]
MRRQRWGGASRNLDLRDEERMIESLVRRNAHAVSEKVVVYECDLGVNSLEINQFDVSDVEIAMSVLFTRHLLKFDELKGFSDINLHCDKRLMPRNASAWSACAWNFLGTTSKAAMSSALPTGSICFSHPVPSVLVTVAAQELHRVQGSQDMWFYDVYQGYGFHEDGLKASKRRHGACCGRLTPVAAVFYLTRSRWSRRGRRPPRASWSPVRRQIWI